VAVCTFKVGSQPAIKPKEEEEEEEAACLRHLLLHCGYGEKILAEPRHFLCVSS